MEGKKHGADGRRTWRKLHLGVDPATHMIVAQSLTENNIHDGDQVESLLEQVESAVDAFYGDGAYDQWKVHDSLAEQEIEAIIPPHKNVKIKQHVTRAKRLCRETKRFEKSDVKVARAGKSRSVTIAAAWLRPP